MDKELLAMNLRNLQLFAEGGDGGTGAESDGTDVGENTGENPAKENDFKAPQSQSELDSLTNKAVQKALDKYRAGEKERIAEAIKKEKDYANLSAAERAKRSLKNSKRHLLKKKKRLSMKNLSYKLKKTLFLKVCQLILRNFCSWKC